MGTGKTQFTKSLITQLYRNRSDNPGNQPLGILIFDYKGDYNEQKTDFVKATEASVYRLYRLPINPLAIIDTPQARKPLLPRHVANTFMDTLRTAGHMGPVQAAALSRCLDEAYARRGIHAGDSTTWVRESPTFDTVYQVYRDDEAVKKTDTLAAFMDKIQRFEIFEPDAAKTQPLFDLLRGVVVIDLSGYDTDLQNLVVAIILDQFYSQMHAGGHSLITGNLRQLTRFILVDEADNFMKEGFPSLKKILKEGREFGVGTILSTQFLKHFEASDDDFSKYILTWVVHKVSDLKPQQVEAVFGLPRFFLG